MTLAIDIDQLQKTVAGAPVLREFSLHVPAHLSYGLLGPARSGKSLALQIILGLVRPDRGAVTVLGRRVTHHRLEHVGYVPPRQPYHPHISGREYLLELGAFSGLRGALLQRRVDDQLDAVELADDGDAPIFMYSRLMLQRLGLAQALLNDPELVLLDEPFGGLNADEAAQLLPTLQRLRSRGLTTLAVTRAPAFAEAFCDRVGILADGRVAAEFTIAGLHDVGQSVTIHLGGLPPAVRSTLRALGPAVRCEDLRVTIEPNSAELQAEVLRTLLDARVAILSLDGQRRPLEELYRRVLSHDYVPSQRSDPRATPIETPVEARSAAARARRAALRAANRGETLLRDLIQRTPEPSPDDPAARDQR